jgi:hypothetical protein
MKVRNIFCSKKLRVIRWTIILFGMLSHVPAGYGQTAPSAFDGAPVLEPMQIETALFVSAGNVSFDGAEPDKGVIPGIRLGFGIVKHFDVRLCYSRGIYNQHVFTDWSEWEDLKLNNITIVPKVSLGNEVVAFRLPCTFSIYRDEYTGKLNLNYTMSSCLAISAHIRQYVEFSLSPSLGMTLYNGGHDSFFFAGGSFGMAFSSNLKKWSVRPEVYGSVEIPAIFSISGSVGEQVYGYGLSASFNLDMFRK